MVYPLPLRLSSFTRLMGGLKTEKEIQIISLSFLNNFDMIFKIKFSPILVANSTFCLNVKPPFDPTSKVRTLLASSHTTAAMLEPDWPKVKFSSRVKIVTVATAYYL